MVVYNAYTAPEIRHRIGICRVIRQGAYAFRQIDDVRDFLNIQFLKHSVRNQPFNHVIRRDKHIVSIARLQFCIHHFVGIEIFQNDFYAELFFKITDKVLTHIFAPVIELERVRAVFFHSILRGFAASAAAG